jgi:hypothetical protein
VWSFLLVALALAPQGSWPDGAPREGADPDSVALVRQARAAQANFERVRVYHAPWGWSMSGGACDERVGRFCLRFLGERNEEERPPYRPPEEHPSIRTARVTLDSTLVVVAGLIPGDPWVVGQLTRYRGEDGRWEDALAAARGCRTTRPGWCDLLLGYALNGAGRFAEAEVAFHRVLEAVGPEERRRLLDLDPLLENEVRRELGRLDPGARFALQERAWVFGNPLFILGGNVLFTEHMARHAQARVHAEARNPHGISWGSDMTEILVRFGPEAGYERGREPALNLGPAPVVGRYAWDAKGVFPTLEGLLDPGGAGPGEFPAAAFRARSRHAPAGIPRIRGLETRVTRFLRGDSLLVVAAWRIPDAPDWDSVPPLDVAEGGLFVVAPGSDTPERWVPSAHPVEGALRGVGTAGAPLGEAQFSVEMLDREGGRAWRHREGLRWEGERPGPGVVALSDLLLLEPESSASAGGGGSAPTDDHLDRHLHRALPGDTLPAGRVEVAWEVYGDPGPEARLPFVLTVVREERGWLRRAGEALRLVSPVDPVEVRWEEGVAPESEGAPLFRRVVLELSSLDSGPWTLRLTLPRPDGDPVVAETEVVIR